MTKPEPTADIPDNLVNLRDLGGLRAEGGTLTRPAVVYRGDAPRVHDRAPDSVPQWPPAVVVDLRDTDELAEQAHPLAEVATVCRVPLLEGVRDDVLAEQAWVSLEELYLFMVDRAPKRLVEVFRIALEAEGPVLVHCAAGKDRTGVVSALLLGAVGVSREEIVADYERTAGNMYRVLKRLNQAPELPPGVDEEAIRELIAAPTEAIEAVLGRFDQSGAGSVGWLREQGVTAAEIQQWKDKFLATP